MIFYSSSFYPHTLSPNFVDYVPFSASSVSVKEPLENQPHAVEEFCVVSVIVLLVAASSVEVERK